MPPPDPLEDTQPRRIQLPPTEEPARPGCFNSLMVAGVILIGLVMSFAAIALAGVAGWRDGGIARQTQQAAALVGTLDRQATLAGQNLAEGQYEMALNRCQYVLTLQPFYPNVRPCLATAQAGLNPTATPTPLPPTATATQAPVVPTFTPPPAGSFSPEALLARGREALTASQFEDAVKWLEAVRSSDATYQRRDVEALLLQAYQSLGTTYRFEGRFSEMVFVMEKALKLDPLSKTDWRFTIDAAKLYLSARGYLDANDFALAAQVFNNLMAMAPAFSTDTKVLACKAFAAAGDSGAMARYGC
jgi:tetratricopeptide (TPR) repeat protein